MVFKWWVGVQLPYGLDFIGIWIPDAKMSSNNKMASFAIWILDKNAFRNEKFQIPCVINQMITLFIYLTRTRQRIILTGAWRKWTDQWGPMNPSTYRCFEWGVFCIRTWPNRQRIKARCYNLIVYVIDTIKKEAVFFYLIWRFFFSMFWTASLVWGACSLTSVSWGGWEMSSAVYWLAKVR